MATLATVFVVGVACRLGIWQLERSGEQRERLAALEARHEAPEVGNAELVAGGDLAFRRARLVGTFEDAPPALVTGGLVGERPGYRWFAPLRLSGDGVVLVDRGWIPAEATGAELAALRPQEEVGVEGMLIPLEGTVPTPPRRTADGRAIWALESDRLLGVLPRVLGPPLESIGADLGADAAPYALLAGPLMETETRRIPGEPPIGGYALPVSHTHHLSYAAQWFAIGGLILAVWAWASLDRTGSTT